MDMLEVGRGMSEEEDKTHFGMWCIMSSPLLIGCDLNKLNETALLLLQNEELIALNQDRLGLQAYVVERTNDCYILVKDVEELYGKKRAISIYNPSDSEKKIRVEFEALDLFGEIKARDLFERKDIGVFEDSMLVSLPAHSCRIYVFEAKERKERKIYEAETAWLSAYQELEDNKSKISAVYKEMQGVSGGAIVENLGEEEENDLQWRAVYSEEGGKYEMNLSYLCNQDRNLNISVNGKTVEQITLNASGEQKTKKQSFEIELGKGNNVIRLYSNKGKMPDIDCMELRKIR
jgi:DNA-binding HxlR family transcriptional regulator